MWGWWLVMVSLAGLAGYAVHDVLRRVPRSNEDFVFC